MSKRQRDQRRRAFRRLQQEVRDLEHDLFGTPPEENVYPLTTYEWVSMLRRCYAWKHGRTDLMTPAQLDAWHVRPTSPKISAAPERDGDDHG